MRIRTYAVSDLPDVVALFTASVHELAQSHYDAAQRDAWAPREPELHVWGERLRPLHILLAVDDGALCGFVGYEDDGHIDLLFTAPARARAGVASQLYVCAEQSLAASGATELTTEASELARPFFARHGFDVIETQIVQRQAGSLRRYAMRKRLQ